MIEYHLDEARSLALVTMSGLLDDAVVVAWFEEFLDAMSKHRRVGGVVDTRGIEAFQVTSQAVRQLGRIAEGRDASFAGSRWAVIANQDAVFGMARMFELLRQESSFEIQVFRSEEDAWRWAEARV